MSTQVALVRNVNEALRGLRDTHAYSTARDVCHGWRRISPRGKETLEHVGPYITEYLHPTERVLFSPERDANPFFHFFEALWILAGRADVAFLKQFISTIDQFSDDGMVFHAPYGYRLRSDGGCLDQIVEVIEVLRKDPDSRQAVLTIWNPVIDLNVMSKDIPCNDMIFLKIRDGKLEMTVCCRSNDAIWGAYGANAVQFSVLQEFIAGCLGVDVGPYRQVSDSFHIYTDNEAWKRLTTLPEFDDYGGSDTELPPILDLYATVPGMAPYPMFRNIEVESALNTVEFFLQECDMGVPTFTTSLGVIDHVAIPMWRAWQFWKQRHSMDYHRGINLALEQLRQCAAPDWKYACEQWLIRRRK